MTPRKDWVTPVALGVGGVGAAVGLYLYFKKEQKLDLTLAKIEKVTFYASGKAPGDAIMAGDILMVEITWHNTDVLAMAPEFRADIVIAGKTPQEGAWVKSPMVAPDESSSLTCSRWIPSDWTGSVTIRIVINGVEGVVEELADAFKLAVPVERPVWWFPWGTPYAEIKNYSILGVDPLSSLSDTPAAIPVPVMPGGKARVRVHWKNIGDQTWGPKLRLDIKELEFGARWKDSMDEVVEAPYIAPSLSTMTIVERSVPADWPIGTKVTAKLGVIGVKGPDWPATLIPEPVFFVVSEQLPVEVETGSFGLSVRGLALDIKEYLPLYRPITVPLNQWLYDSVSTPENPRWRGVYTQSYFSNVPLKGEFGIRIRSESYEEAPYWELGPFPGKLNGEWGFYTLTPGAWILDVQTGELRPYE